MLEDFWPKKVVNFSEKVVNLFFRCVSKSLYNLYNLLNFTHWKMAKMGILGVTNKIEKIRKIFEKKFVDFWHCFFSTFSKITIFRIRKLLSLIIVIKLKNQWTFFREISLPGCNEQCSLESNPTFEKKFVYFATFLQSWRHPDFSDWVKFFV